MSKELKEPKGIGFFSVKTGETHYCKLEPTIAAYINSSDMGINASRGQDYGWRLAPEWVKRIKAFKSNRTQMSILTAKNQGKAPSTVQILYYMYGEELAAYYASKEENENPFEEEYANAVSSNASTSPKVKKSNNMVDEESEKSEDMSEIIDDSMKKSPKKANNN